ncbi:MAG TPA: LysM peptidoglycan-binding domain-containing protein [Gemmatimonadaceae bacterium]|nr:LysM peptidoglycan-binding domain-containing protein [Gemmatimonadaceae bacterium]
MRARVAWLALLCAAAACHSAKPALAPTPVEIPSLPDSVIAAAESSMVAPHDVTTEAVKMFGDSTAPPVDSAEDDEPTWDIDVQSYATRERVMFYIDRFQHGTRDGFTRWLKRSGRYEPMIRAKLRAAGLPEDMVYLALIESGFDPDAYSNAAAVGMWQFMASTARDVGLRVDWWVDERRDPVRSTDGAIKFLKWLNDQFGSLYLAAAAYDGGPGRVERGLSRYADELDGVKGDDIFFALAEKNYLRAETRDYVPKLIAAALVAKDPSRYGFDSLTYDPPLEYDSVRVGPSTPLAAVAEAAGVSTDDIIALNPYILRGVTPPRDSFTVRVPPGHADGFDAAYVGLPDGLKRAYRHAETKKGETMASLARRGGVTVRQLSWYNPRLRTTRHGTLYSGQAVLFPSNAVVRAARNVPDPSIEKYGSSRGRTVTHVVREGESLWSIAEKYKTTAQAIQRLNGFKKSIIFPGQIIIVKGSPARSHSSRSASGRQVHIVKPGETLTSIAHKYDTTIKELKSLNGLHSDAIQAGQKLIIGD